MFGDTLRELRLSKKLTQEETAKIIGVLVVLIRIMN